jgi:5-deoxy-glucuronate isomerase
MAKGNCRSTSSINKLLIPPERFANRIDDFGFEFIAFENRKMAAGQTFCARTGTRELGLVLLGGICSVDSSAGAFSSFGKRPNVFAGLPLHALPADLDGV